MYLYEYLLKYAPPSTPFRLYPDAGKHAAFYFEYIEGKDLEQKEKTALRNHLAEKHGIAPNNIYHVIKRMESIVFYLGDKMTYADYIKIVLSQQKPTPPEGAMRIMKHHTRDIEKWITLCALLRDHAFGEALHMAEKKLKADISFQMLERLSLSAEWESPNYKSTVKYNGYEKVMHEYICLLKNRPEGQEQSLGSLIPSSAFRG